VVGAGHSAMQAVLDLMALARTAPHTEILWAFRRPIAAVSFGGGSADGLPERGALGARALALIESGAVTAYAPFLIDDIGRGSDGAWLVSGAWGAGRETLVVDRMVVATGHEQVRSIAAALAGDWAAAHAVRLELPATGVCVTDRATATDCCTPATPQGVCCPPKPAQPAGAACCPTAGAG
jgi:hypothetical protein